MLAKLTYIQHRCGCIKRLGSRSDYSPTFWVARQKRLRNTDLECSHDLSSFSVLPFGIYPWNLPAELNIGEHNKKGCSTILILYMRYLLSPQQPISHEMQDSRIKMPTHRVLIVVGQSARCEAILVGPMLKIFICNRTPLLTLFPTWGEFPLPNPGEIWPCPIPNQDDGGGGDLDSISEGGGGRPIKGGTTASLLFYNPPSMRISCIYRHILFAIRNPYTQ